jgi:ribosomal protein S18 acetylase RimI-like enzyme
VSQEVCVSPTDLSRIRVLERYDEIAPFLPAITAASDANREFLGFVPRSVFQEFARQSDMFALVIERDGGLNYVGHLLFARRHPRAKVLQLFIHKEYRGQKYARLLCERLVELLTRQGFTSIYARVGEDMQTANETWHALGFRVQRTELGGAASGRTIVVRVRELHSPQLFPVQTVDSGDPLGLSRSLSTETPLFLLDLNVLFDLSPRRERHEDALSLFQAERANFCRLAISDEIIAELARTGPPGRPDAMMNLARTFTRFPVSVIDEGNPLVSDLTRMVFPNKIANSLSPNDRSDIRHLVTAIENELSGLITNDEAILSSANTIERRFGVQVLSPKVFQPDDHADRRASAYEVGSSDLELLPAGEADDSQVRPFLMRLGLKAADIASGWSRIASRSYIVRSESRLVGFVAWPAVTHDRVIIVRAAIDESAPNPTEIARGIIMHAMIVNVGGPTVLRLKTPPNQVLLRDVARGVGFSGLEDSSDLTKLAFGRVATKANWQSCRSELAEICGLKMDGLFPSYRRMGQQIPYTVRNGDAGYETLERIETLLSPALFCLPARPAVITPIRHEYAKLLLGHSKQGSLLPAPTSQLFDERHYIGGPNAFSHLKRGTLMFFYESNPPRGKGELVAIARVRRSYLRDTGDFRSNDLTQSVLNHETLGQIGRADVKCVTVFDNVFSLPKMISLDRLKDLGCGQPNDLITTRPISDTQLQAILSEALKA